MVLHGKARLRLNRGDDGFHVAPGKLHSPVAFLADNVVSVPVQAIMSLGGWFLGPNGAEDIAVTTLIEVQFAHHTEGLQDLQGPVNRHEPERRVETTGFGQQLGRCDRFVRQPRMSRPPLAVLGCWNNPRASEDRPDPRPLPSSEN